MANYTQQERNGLYELTDSARAELPMGVEQLPGIAGGSFDRADVVEESERNEIGRAHV